MLRLLRSIRRLPSRPATTPSTSSPTSQPWRSAVTTRTGAVMPEPYRSRMGMLTVFGVVIPGLMIGGWISQNIARILEENDLFVPSDDDDDM